MEYRLRQPGWGRAEYNTGKHDVRIAIAGNRIGKVVLGNNATLINGVIHYNDGYSLPTSKEVEDYRARMACTE